jgi:hypothetical protein
VKVFANVNATLIQERKKDLEAGQLMACHVATIVKHNVNTAHFRYDGSQKCRIILRTDAYMSVAFIELTATIVNIDPEQKGFGPEIPSPQRQRTALRDIRAYGTACYGTVTGDPHIF